MVCLWTVDRLYYANIKSERCPWLDC